MLISMQLEKVIKKIEKYTYMKECLERHSQIREEDSLETIVFKLYIICESLVEIAHWVNEHGHKINSKTGTRKYRSKDISEIIKHANNVDPELSAITRKIFYLNKKGVKEKEWDKDVIRISNYGSKI